MHRIKTAIGALLICIISLACKNETSKGTENGSANAATATKRDPKLVTFHFSTAPSVQGFRDARDWCNLTFRKAYPFYAESGNSRLRYFFLPDKSTIRLAVNRDNITASMILRSGNGEQIELFTSNNFPSCLSIHQNFKLSPDGAFLHYENDKRVSFDLKAEKVQPGFTKVVLELPQDVEYALLCHECIGCGEH
jgi:hypothetical protein